MVKKKAAPEAEGVGYYVQRDERGRIIGAFTTPQRGPAIYGDVEKEIIRLKRVKGENGEEEFQEIRTTEIVNEVVGYEPGPAEEWYEGEPEIYRPQSIEATLAERDKRLAESDWVVIRAMERGEEVPQAWRNYRDALRAISESTDLETLEWPEKPE